MGRTLLGTLPRAEVAEFASLERQGQAVFASGLREMAGLVRLNAQLKSILKSTLVAAAFAVLVLWLSLMVGLPYFSGPTLLETMPNIPSHYMASYSQSFLGWPSGSGTIPSRSGQRQLPRSRYSSLRFRAWTAASGDGWTAGDHTGFTGTSRPSVSSAPPLPP
ncbi:hypothetical protein WJ978_18220 [Achromobacter xylosoxidans]